MRKKLFIFCKIFTLFLIWLIPFLIVIKPIVEGGMAFWYDPARDLLMAWDNLKKPTLIGPTSGIPGIFYGPQWIWLLSLPLIISKDPRLVVFLTITLPYFILFPYLLWRLSKNLLSVQGMVIVWLLFIFAFNGYLTQIWSPNLAPLFFFIILVIFYKTKIIYENRSLLNFFILGFFQGLLLNHHISFGVGITVSWFLYFIGIFIYILFKKEKKTSKLKNWFFNSLFFFIGFIIILTPFFLFELRHGFIQLKSLFYTLSQGFLHNKAVVGQMGLTKGEIITKFIDRLTDLLAVSHSYSILALIVLMGFLFPFKKIKDNQEGNLLTFLIFNIFGVLIVYLSARNPVWDYHFIGVEIIFLFLLIIVLKKYYLVRNVLMIWVAILLLININKFRLGLSQRSMIPPELLIKRLTVDKIYQDAGNRPFGYFGKNAAIYTYDYDYMFRWVGMNKNFIPKSNSSENVNDVYLIIPKELLDDEIGFTQNRTPENIYQTVKKWEMADGTLIIKRELRLQR